MHAAAFAPALPVRGALRRSTVAARSPRCAPSRTVRMTAAAAEKMLHAVYRVGDMERTGVFLKALGMQLLRARDIPAEKYANAFYGFGTESQGKHFSLELTYNYGVETYSVGDALELFSVAAPDVSAAAARVRDAGFDVKELANGNVRTTDPTGYAFELIQESRRDGMRALRLGVSDLDRSVAFYKALGMELHDHSGTSATVGYGAPSEAATLQLSQRADSAPGNAGNGYAQIAVSTESVYGIADRMRARDVVIAREPGPVAGIGTKICAVRDPDGFKIVFVDGEDFEKELLE